MPCDVQRLTAEQSEAHFRELWEALTEEQQYRLVNECLTQDQKDELALQWEPEPDDAEG